MDDERQGLPACYSNLMESDSSDEMLRESEKELNCLTAISQVLTNASNPLAEALQSIVDLIPPAWKYPERTDADIQVRELCLKSRFSAGRRGGEDRADLISAREPLIVLGDQIGYVSVSVLPDQKEPQVMLDSELRLLASIAILISHLILRNEAMHAVSESARSLEAKSTALREIMAHIDEEKASSAEKLRLHLHNTILPMVTRLRYESLNESQRDLYLDELESAIRAFDAESPPSHSYFGIVLSPREIEIAALIRYGLSTKQIADKLNLSELTIERHRHNIRRKLGIAGTGTNLTTYLRQSG